MRLLKILFPVLILACFYVGRKIYILTASLFGQTQGVAFALVIVGAVVIFYPSLLLLSNAIRPGSSQGILSGQHRLLDFLAAPFWFGAIFLAEVLPWLLLLDFLKLPFYPLYTKFQTVWWHFEHRIITAFLISYAIYVLFRLIFDSVRIRVSKHIMRLPKLPSRLEGFRIAHISDVKLDKRTGLRRLKRYVKRTNRLKADIIFFTGDLTASERMLIPGTQIIGELESKYGALACLGELDAQLGSEEVLTRLRTQQISAFEDKNKFIRVGQEDVLVTIVSNHYGKKAMLDNLNYLMGQQPRGAIDIMIAHQPSETLIELAEERGYHLFFAGHTNGGQIILKLMGLTFSPAKAEAAFFKGVRYVKRMMVNINSGLGFSLIPFRFRAPAEITLVTLRQQEEQE